MIDEDSSKSGATVTVDGLLVSSDMVQWLNLADGAHEVLLKINGHLSARSVFTVKTDQVTHYSVPDTGTIPTSIVLPDAQGASTPVRMRVSNTGTTRTRHLRFLAGDQPDFNSYASIQAYLLGKTAEMSEPEKAVFLMDFITRWSLTEEAWYESDYEQDYYIPQYFNRWGYGECGDQATVFALLAELVGWDSDNVQTYGLNGHVVAELYYNEAWHLFDLLNCSYYTDETGTILSAQNIEADPSLILDFTDAFGRSSCLTPMVTIPSLYASVEDNTSNPVMDSFGPQADLALYPGDTLDLFPWGFGISTCIQCSRRPKNVGTGILTRTIPVAALSDPIVISGPFAIGGFALTLESEANRATVDVNIQIHGSLNNLEKDLQIDCTQTTRTDLSSLIYDTELGYINEITITLSDVPQGLTEVLAESYFQIPPKWFPQITHDVRQIDIEGTAEDLSIDIDYMDALDTIASTEFTLVPWPSTEYVLSNGRQLLSLYALTRRSDGLPAVGHEMTVVSDHPDEIEIFTSARVGWDKGEPVASTRLGATRYRTDLENYKVFFARSKQVYTDVIGPVSFTLLVDGEPAATLDFPFVPE